MPENAQDESTAVETDSLASEDVEALMEQAAAGPAGDAEPAPEQAEPEQPVDQLSISDQTDGEREPLAEAEADDVSEPDEVPDPVEEPEQESAEADTADPAEPPATGSSESMLQRRTALTARMQTLAAKLTTTADQIQQLKVQRDEARSELQKAEEATRQLQAKLESERADRQTDEEQVNGQIASVEEELTGVRQEVQALLEEKSQYELQRDERLDALETENLGLVAQLDESRRANGDLRNEIEKLRLAHSRAVQECDEAKDAHRKTLQNNRQLSTALEQTEKVISATEDQFRFTEAVTEAFGDIERSLEMLDA